MLILSCLTGLDLLKEEEYLVLRIVIHLVSDGCIAADPKSQLLLREANLWGPPEFVCLCSDFQGSYWYLSFASLFWRLSLSMPLRFNLAVGRWLIGRHFENMHLVGIALNSLFSSDNHNCLEGLADCHCFFIFRISAPVKVSVRRCITFSACSCRIAGKFLLMEQLFSQDRYSPKQVQVAIKSSKCT